MKGQPLAIEHRSWPAYVGMGVGLKSAHYAEIREAPGRVDWFEAITENFLDSHGPARRQLEAIRANHPVALHGVAMSLGSADGVDAAYLDHLAELAAAIEPMWISDHLCFSSLGGHHSHDLLPLPLTDEALRIAVENILRVQDRLGRRIAVENISTYVRTRADTISEAEFVAEVAARADCLLLLDVNNVVVNAFNHGLDPLDYVRRMPAERIVEIHVAGHSRRDDFLFDDHVGPTPDVVWDLYTEALRHARRPVSTLIEWDTDVPAFARLAEEADRARERASAALAPR